MKRFPLSIDIYKHADIGFAWQGDVAIGQFARLVAQVAQHASSNGVVSVDCTLSRRGFKLPWLSATAQTTVQVHCQRCLEPMDMPLMAALNFALVGQVEQIDKLNSDEEYVILGVEHLVGDSDLTSPNVQVDLLAIIEDELLLQLPSAPKHADCQVVQPHVMVDDVALQRASAEQHAPGELQSPFAVLQKLKH